MINKNIINQLLENKYPRTTLTLNSMCRPCLDNSGIQTLCDALKVNTNVQILNLSENIGDDGAEHISEMLKVNTSIHTLNLSNNNISDKGAISIANALALNINTTLKCLNLPFNIIGNKGMISIIDMLKNNNTLDTLYIGYNRYDIHAIKYILREIKTNTTLLTLCIACKTRFDESIIVDISELLKNNKTLHNLFLSSANAIIDNEQLIMNALELNPSITHIDYYGKPSGIIDICGRNMYNLKLKNMMLVDVL